MVADRQAAGASKRLSLGFDPAERPAAMSSNAFANGSNQNAGNMLTDRPSTRLHQAPGGASSVCLSHDAAGAAALQASSNAFANGSNQNAGNILTDRPSTRLHQAPGGASSVCLSHDGVSVGADTTNAATGGFVLGRSRGDAATSLRTSSNAFANGSNQNAGNVLTDRPSTRCHQAPGGMTSVCLSHDARDAALQENVAPQAPASPVILGGRKDTTVTPQKVTSNAFARGSSQNVGNVLTERPSTRLNQAPGGKSTICLGGDDPKDAVVLG